jgi:hypothetical protein
MSRQTGRFRILCTALGCMSKVSSVTVYLGNDQLNSRHFAILRSMPHMKQLSLHVHLTYEDEETIRKLAATLYHHACLASIRFMVFLPPKYFSIIMPALHTIQSLEKVSLCGWTWNENPPDAAHAAMDVILRTRPDNSKIMFDLSLWKFPTQEAHDFVCAALAETMLSKLDLSYCEFFNPVSLAKSLTQSKLKKLQFSKLTFANDKPMAAAFFDALSLGIRGMTQLEEFDCGEMYSQYTRRFVDAEIAAEQQRGDYALIQVIHALAQCHNLKVFKLYFNALSTEVDQALAACVASVNNQLVEIHICCRPLERSVGLTKVTEFPALMVALKTNYKIQRIVFTTACSLRSTQVDPWNPNLKKSIEIVPKLNSAGREYITLESADKTAGYKVLEEVNEDLDCLFYHTRENPPLCVRQTGKAGDETIMGQGLGQVYALNQGSVVV